MNKTQNWLISELKHRKPEMYIDNSNLYKIMTGEIKNSAFVPVINDILGLSSS